MKWKNVSRICTTWELVLDIDPLFMTQNGQRQSTTTFEDKEPPPSPMAVTPPTEEEEEMEMALHGHRNGH